MTELDYLVARLIRSKNGETSVNNPAIITLLTDFGLRDPYVGIMKGVILSLNPDARIIDISHAVKAGSIIHGAGIIQETYIYFPEGTIHVVVVDPGVGSDRRPILVKTKDRFFIGPDNGLFWPVIKTNHHTEIIHLTDTRHFLPNISSTFHGRDIFAPVAGHVSLGVDPSKMGAVINDPVPLHFPSPEQKNDILSGQVMRVDRFGNLISNIHIKDIEGYSGIKPPIIETGRLSIRGLHNTYSEVGAGKVLALIGSAGCLEIAVNQGRACDLTGIKPEDTIGTKVDIKKG